MKNCKYAVSRAFLQAFGERLAPNHIQIPQRTNHDDLQKCGDVRQIAAE